MRCENKTSLANFMIFPVLLSPGDSMAVCYGNGNSHLSWPNNEIFALFLPFILLLHFSTLAFHTCDLGSQKSALTDRMLPISRTSNSMSMSMKNFNIDFFRVGDMSIIRLYFRPSKNNI